jgi:hypothetical protein
MRWHNGQTAGYHAWLGVIPDKHLGVIVLANAGSDRITKLGELVMRAAQGEDAPPLEPKKPTPERKEIEVEPAILARYAGVYQLPVGIDLTIFVEDGKLLARGMGPAKMPLAAESPTRFYFKGIDAQVVFLPDAQGNVDTLVIESGGTKIEAPRKK